MSRSRTTSGRPVRIALVLVAALVLSSTQGCVVFGQRIVESEWEPADAAFAVEVTVPLGRGACVAARPNLVPDDTPLAEMYHSSVLPEGHRSSTGSPR